MTYKESSSQQSSAALNSNERGAHSELLAQTALIANGYEVLLPLTDSMPYDMAFRVGGETYFVQVKTGYVRDEERYNGQWITVKGARNNGRVYDKGNVDYFIMVWRDKCYLFPNREIREYWFREHELGERTIPLETGVDLP